MKLYFFLSEIGFVLANSVDPDEMLHYAAFNLGHHYLSRVSKPLRRQSRLQQTTKF